MPSSTRGLPSLLFLVALLEIIQMLLPRPGQGVVQPAEDQPVWIHTLDSLSSERMLADVRTLSGPSFNGRQTGSEDDLRSAAWVADQFRAAKINLSFVPHDPLNVGHSSEGDAAGTTGFMSKPYQAVVISPEATLHISTGRLSDTQRLVTDFLPVLDSPSAHVRAPIVFVGYGIVDATAGINDYAGVDVRNCMVLFLKGKPDHFKGTVTHADKIRIARQNGAVGYLTTTGPILSSYELRRGMTGQPSAFYGLAPPADNLPGAWISTSRADRVLAGDDDSNNGRLRRLQEQLNRSSELQSFVTDSFGILEWGSRQEQNPLINVIAQLPGTDPQFTHETIVIGAHRDHFGSQAGILFPGADDNASGTAVMLEVARALAKAGIHRKRTILFVSFSGEEEGLVGSRLYIERPVAALSSTKAMINIDHAGIGNGRLTVGITGLDKGLGLEAGPMAGLTDKLDLYGYFPGGDHVPFTEAGVPTITVVSGGAHSHFHQPTDTADTIQAEILQTVARFVLAITWQLVNTK